MKPLIKNAVSLLLAVVVSAGALWGSDALTRSLIDRQQHDRLHKTFGELLSAQRFDPLETDKHTGITAAYRAVDHTDRLIGYAVSTAVKGYGGTVTVHVAIKPDGESLYGIRIGEHQESTGYGARITEPGFFNQFQNRTAPFALSSATATYRDGVYRAEAGDYDSSGFRDFVELTLSGGEIVSVNWDAQQVDGGTKKELSRAGDYVMSETGLPWHEQARIMEQALLKTQDPTKIQYQADSGKTDAYTGATISVEPFVRLSDEALKAAADQSATAIDGVSGATVSSRAVVEAVNTAVTFVQTIAG